MEFDELFRDAKSTITIVGTNPLSPELEASGQYFADLLHLNPDLRLTILCESDSENFSQSLVLDKGSAGMRKSYTSLSVHRDRVMGRTDRDGLRADIAGFLGDVPHRQKLLDRVVIRQVNLRLPINLVEADGRLWYCVTTAVPPRVSDYLEVPAGSPNYTQYKDFIDFYLNPSKGGIYLSRPGEELIQLYDPQGYPRGIFPRACFYTTAYARYSIWGFVFNRKGEMLLHQRSMSTKDGRGLWDKSVGGHVDLRDSSTHITAERELVEELFLPEAEYSKYIRADLGDIIHFGEWNTKKRPERTLRPTIADLGPSDWAMFRATDVNGEPLVVTRVSDRRIHDDDGKVSTKRTVFRSDVYLFIAPKEYLDTEEQMDRLVGTAEISGAAQDHRLVSVDELRSWIETAEREGTDRETFTDDILYINLQYRDLLETFAEFIAYLP